MNQLEVLTAEQHAIYDILFSTKFKFNIDLNWCNDELYLLEFVQLIEIELNKASLHIVEQTLILTLSNRTWNIKIDRINEKNNHFALNVD